MVLKKGDSVGAFAFVRPDSSPVRLGEFTAPALVLIFLRHLA